MAFLHGVVAFAQAATALLHGVERSAQAATGLLHGVERGAQVRDGFTTRCSKVRASRRFLKNQCIKLINSNMSLTFALFAPRKGTQSVERGEWMLFYFERCY